MSQSRRCFIKYVVAGSIASGCPIDKALLEEPGGAAATPLVEGEHFAVCHQIRDGHSFPKPDATKKPDIVIIGGGLAGQQMDAAGVKELASLPSLDELRGKLVGLLQAPATRLARGLQAPAGQVARVFAAYGESQGRAASPSDT